MCRSSFDETLLDEVFSEKTSDLVEALRTLSRVEVLFTTSVFKVNISHKGGVRLEIYFVKLSSLTPRLCEMFTLRTLVVKRTSTRDKARSLFGEQLILNI